ncbi:hypothetical protein CC1G_02913 [Coprinopsis cinerea okayama7|uniref:C2H2-type domain-containing protein n=1 Tax=Coprinopsis cinerea (strain Okayama-7 / 130 / ATCC MYA-4618 / FGSC 9003) TaxID=240176 RepID=A8NRP8_COPC7|nr:hypothetical protein CC1G_02913 [Coprinopsis cinerea okayama7\|eukprot:XP_001835825.1 hypothetical protein CC1G_02913 [Coprinopsis cinerea okayama7\
MAYPTNLQQWPVFPESLDPAYTTSDPNEHDYLAPQVEGSYTHGGMPVYVSPQYFQTQQNLLAFKSPYEDGSASIGPLYIFEEAEGSPSSSSTGSLLSTPATYRQRSLPLPEVRQAPIRDEPTDQDSDYQDDRQSDDDDDEYVPSNDLSTSRKRRRAPSKPSRQPKASTSARVTKPLPARKTKKSNGQPPAKRPRIASSSRFPQADGAIADLIRRALESPTAVDLNFFCPVCRTAQGNKRMPDFKRHLSAHIRASPSDESKGWWCKGLLYSEFLTYSHKEQDQIRRSCSSDGEVYMFNGKQRIGGCRMTFSRRDALKRHLNNKGGICYGKACAAGDN